MVKLLQIGLVSIVVEVPYPGIASLNHLKGVIKGVKLPRFGPARSTF